MNRLFHISEYLDSFKSQLVFSTSYLSLENYLYDLATILHKRKYKGNVIIDLLLSNGKAKNRYIQIYFDGANFKIDLAKILRPNKELKEKSLNFYANNSEFLYNSVLNKSQVYLIKKKIQI
ncbi:type II toxin-antitoxin system RnlB family antitoxin [Saccharicrinis sp. FJH2]|uniref:type II toxin-antitoxin system RnlB family antitoxin n=1 Tax=Saccharicrinis sp. FJH65 TaxID=3344659 RepID=UPI0035F34903